MIEHINAMILKQQVSLKMIYIMAKQQNMTNNDPIYCRSDQVYNASPCFIMAYMLWCFF